MDWAALLAHMDRAAIWATQPAGPKELKRPAASKWAPPAFLLPALLGVLAPWWALFAFLGAGFGLAALAFWWKRKRGL